MKSPLRWHILSVGKAKLPFAKPGVEFYLGRIRQFAEVREHIVKAGSRPEESAALHVQSEGCFRLILDERGEQCTSLRLADRLGDWELRGVRQLAVIIGGAEGHEEKLRRSADWLWSLSPLALQHELALIVALEQIYRAYTIRAGLPYHRE